MSEFTSCPAKELVDKSTGEVILPDYHCEDPAYVDDKDNPELLDKRLEEMQLSFCSDYLSLHTMEEIYGTVYKKRPPVVEGLLDYGTILLAGTAKAGKSFLALQLAYSVATGKDFLSHKTNQTGVIYFALEDSERRIQERLQLLFGCDTVASNLYFCTNASLVGHGFEGQLESALTGHPNVGLVIVDVLQKIRDPEEKSEYGADYKFMGTLKALTDKHGVCLILIHHTRKLWDADPTNMISGSRGMTATADGTMVLQRDPKEKYFAELTVTGREIPDQKLSLIRKQETPEWMLIPLADLETKKAEPDRILTAVCSLLSPEQPIWNGPAEALVAEVGLDMAANSLSRYLNCKASVLEKIFHVDYSIGRTRTARFIRMRLLPTDKPETA